MEARKTRVFLILTIGSGLLTALLIVLQSAMFARVISGVFLEGEALADVAVLLVVLVPVILLRALMVWSAERFAHRAAAGVKDDLRRRLLTRMFELGPVQVKRERTGELVNVLVEGVEAIESYFSGYLPQVALAALMPVFFLFFIFPRDVLSGGLLLLTAPLIPLFMFLIGKWADSLSQKQWQSLSRMSAHYLDVLQGLTTLKLFGRSKAQIAIIARVSDDFRKTTLGVLRVAFLSALTLELLATLSTALVAVALGLRLVYGQMGFEHAFFILLLAPEFYLPLRRLGAQYHAGMSGVSAAERIFEVLDLPVADEDGGSLAQADASVGRMSASINKENDNQIDSRINNWPLRVTTRPEGFCLSLRDIDYTYEPEKGPVLRGVTLELHSGEIVALVGDSGAGKSTLAAVLVGLVEPDSGWIGMTKIPPAPEGGSDIDSGVANAFGTADTVRAERRRSLTAYVPQHPHLFFGTVAENICLGAPSAGRDEMIAAAKAANAHAFISRLPQQYDTRIGEGGARLSGGQAQRLALAKAFLKNASVLVLDEATSGLDRESERLVLASLRQNRAKGVLIVAHRLHLASEADRILVMQDGRIVEDGDHAALMAKQGAYFRLVEAYGGVG